MGISSRRIFIIRRMRRRGDIIGVWSLLIRGDDIVLEKQQMLLNYSLKLENLSTGLKSMLIITRMNNKIEWEIC